jgi:zinc transport system substrate-binding protein
MLKKNLGIIISGAIFLIFIGLVLVWNSGPDTAMINPTVPATGAKIKVSTSFYPLYFFASQIGGDKAEVTNITPAGSEPHDYEPTAADILQIENSQLLILNGGGLEAWGNNVSQNINANFTKVIVAGEGLTTQQITENGQSVIDPHVWLSPTLAAQMVDKIVQGFIAVDPINQVYYQANADSLKAKLTILDREYAKGLSNCAQQDIVTSHAAFGYLAASYHLQQIPIAGLSPDAEPSPQQLVNLVSLVREQQIKYIFFESLVSPKLAQTMAHEVGAQTLILNPLEGLTATELAQGQDYFTEMRSNLINLQIALQCQK